MVTLEVDSAKSESNRTKHGIDFLEAQAHWSDPMLTFTGCLKSRQKLMMSRGTWRLG